MRQRFRARFHEKLTRHTTCIVNDCHSCQTPDLRLSDRADLLHELGVTGGGTQTIRRGYVPPPPTSNAVAPEAKSPRNPYVKRFPTRLGETGCDGHSEDRDFDTRGCLNGVSNFSVHKHLPHYAVLRPSLVDQGSLRPNASTSRGLIHSRKLGNREFNSFVRMPPANKRAGEIVLADSTVFNTLFGAEDGWSAFGGTS